MRVQRAWGYYDVIAESTNYKIKELVVYPNHCLSCQRHAYRSEMWLVTQGKGTVIVGRTVSPLKPGSRVFINIGEWHQLINGTNDTLHIIEVQSGSKCIEEDIERQ